MKSGINRLCLAAAAASLALVAACAASGYQPSPTEESSSPPGRKLTPTESGPMSPQIRINSNTSTSVVGNVGSGKISVTINGRVCQLDVPDAVSVRTVAENSQAYVEITDKNGRTRRIDCSS